MNIHSTNKILFLYLFVSNPLLGMFKNDPLRNISPGIARAVILHQAQHYDYYSAKKKLFEEKRNLLNDEGLSCYWLSQAAAANGLFLDPSIRARIIEDAKPKLTEDQKRIILSKVEIVSKEWKSNRGATRILFNEKDKDVIECANLQKELFQLNKTTGSITESCGYSNLLKIPGLIYRPNNESVVLTGGQHNYEFGLYDEKTETFETRYNNKDQSALIFAFIDKDRFVTGSLSGNIRVWDVDKPDPILSFKAHSSSVIAIVCSSDNKVISGSACFDLNNLNEPVGEIKVWDTEKKWCVKVLQVPGQGITSLACNPVNSNQLLSGLQDGDIKIWDLLSGKCIQTLTGHKDMVFDIAFNPHETGEFASCSKDKTIRVWNLDDFNAASDVVQNEKWTLEEACLLHKFSQRRQALSASEKAHINAMGLNVSFPKAIKKGFFN